MNELFPLVLAFRIAVGGPPTQMTPDRWFAEDKLKHFFMSFAATNLAFGAARTTGLEGGPALLVAGAASAAAGLGKELHDRRNGRPFSRKDLVWDALGIGTGLLLAADAR